ncbi:MAG: tRNA preQ1(34) S-adenosylmethionine ribosyltransferase-isomerase QueA [Pseudomonadota bacterium]
MRVDAFDFDLPKERIALEPAEPRDSSRLLVVGDGALDDRHVRDLPQLLEPGDVVVVNVSRVINARLSGERARRGLGGHTGSPAGVEELKGVAIEAMLLKRAGADVWRALARPAKRLKTGDEVSFGPRLSASVTDLHGEGEVSLRFSKAGAALDAAIEEVGAAPLPPYILAGRPVRPQDTETYQTVYAREAGSVAAPTAGLHFTDRLIADVKARGAAWEELTLHVGAGTFRPVSAETTDGHKMHSEWCSLSAETAERINAARAAGGRLVAVGTTSLRLLESAALASGELQAFEGETDIFITPGYRFRAVDALLTNFHLPKSTLFMLVCAFSGLERMKAAYAHAIANDYRFYSYGDACLLTRRAP